MCRELPSEAELHTSVRGWWALGRVPIVHLHYYFTLQNTFLGLKNILHTLQL